MQHVLHVKPHLPKPVKNERNGEPVLEKIRQISCHDGDVIRGVRNQVNRVLEPFRSHAGAPHLGRHRFQRSHLPGCLIPCQPRRSPGFTTPMLPSPREDGERKRQPSEYRGNHFSRSHTQSLRGLE